MPEKLEHPQGVGGPQVGVVAVHHHGVVPGDALAVHQCGEGLTVEEVAGHRIAEVLVQVDTDGGGQVADVVEDRIGVRLHHLQPWASQLRAEPGAGDQLLRVGVLVQLRVGVTFDSHG